MRKAKYHVGQCLRAVRGPGGALNPEPKFLGKIGTVIGVQEFRTCQPVYVLDFGDLGEDTVEEVCLEECDYFPPVAVCAQRVTWHVGLNEQGI